METNPGKRRINKRLDTCKAFHVVTQPNLNDLVLRDWGSNSIEYIVKSRKTDSLQIFPWIKRLFKAMQLSQRTNPVYLIAQSSRIPEPVPVHSLHIQALLLSISWHLVLGDSSLVRRRRTWPVVLPTMHLTKRYPIPIRHQTAAARVLE